MSSITVGNIEDATHARLGRAAGSRGPSVNAPMQQRIRSGLRARDRRASDGPCRGLGELTGALMARAALFTYDRHFRHVESLPVAQRGNESVQ